MERILQATADGSQTIAIPGMEVTYHSRHGAIRESMHVFIGAGLNAVVLPREEEMRILEMGFGTGLNALLTLAAAEGRPVWYEAIEKFPLPGVLTAALEYGTQLQQPEADEQLQQMHAAPWNEPFRVTSAFTLTKHHCSMEDFQSGHRFHLVYFDAFAPAAQPELWTVAVFQKLYGLMEENGLLVTYCSKGVVRRAMQEAGFRVEKIPGPPGKREMVRAHKTNVG